jgi:glycosyltransferase involved in cell wall biosynthesis
LRNQILISIIIPSFNRAHLIGETLESVLFQTYEHWECIIVDDGSTDDSLEVIKKFVSRDNRIELLVRNREPKGASVCRNIGAEHSKGEFLIFLDSDDLLAEYCLQMRLEFMHNSPNSDCYIFNTEIFQKEPGDLQILWNELDGDKDPIIRFLEQDVPWCISSMLWRRNAFLSLKGFNEEASCWQDWELHIRMLTEELTYLLNSDELPDVFIRRENDPYSINAQEKHKKNALSKLNIFNNLLKKLSLSRTVDLYEVYFFRLFIETLRDTKDTRIIYRTWFRNHDTDLMNLNFLDKILLFSLTLSKTFKWKGNGLLLDFLIKTSTKRFGYDFLNPARTWCQLSSKPLYA